MKVKREWWLQRNETMSAEARVQRAVYKLAKQLEQAAIHSRLDPDNLRRYLDGLRQQFVRDAGSLFVSSGMEEWTEKTGKANIIADWKLP
jgi:hypothetical protein